jgi:hypothetical protein
MQAVVAEVQVPHHQLWVLVVVLQHLHKKVALVMVLWEQVQFYMELPD